MNSFQVRPVITTMEELRQYAATLPPYNGSIPPAKTMEELKKRSPELSTFNEVITKIKTGEIVLGESIKIEESTK